MAAPFAKKLYSGKAWKACRNAYFAYRNGICERCGAPGEEVHHKVYLTPQNIHDPSVVFGWDNLELLCRDCHMLEHEKKKNLRRRKPMLEKDVKIRFDENGNPVPVGRVVIVWGAPGSGKSTYIRENMRHMDVVVDLDRILFCFTGLVNQADDPKAITDYLPFALDVREFVYKITRERRHGIGTTYIAAGLPKRQDRALMQEQFPHAVFVHMDADMQTAMEHALADPERTEKEQVRRIITKYFRDFEPDEARHPPIPEK